MDSSLAILYRKGFQQKAPKSFRKGINQSRKAKAKQELRRNFLNNDWDNVRSVNDKKNASYLYF